MFSSFELRTMRALIRMARRKKGVLGKNPMVAAAVIKDQTCIAYGVHQKEGGDHAEVIALKKAGEKAESATLMVTLEPCTHHGKTPPCTDAIIRSGISHVIYAVEDPSSKITLNPARQVLEAHGIAVSSGLCSEEARQLNEVFFKTSLCQKPFVRLKAGLSLDGKIALSNKKSKYITNKEAQKAVHTMRRECDGVVIGVETVLQDDPMLTTRFNLLKDGYRNPVKIVLDSQVRTPVDARIFSSNEQGETILFHDRNFRHVRRGYPPNTRQLYVSSREEGGLDWSEILSHLFSLSILDLIIEGGQRVFSSALSQNCVDKVYFFYAPKLIAESSAPSPFSCSRLRDLTDAKTLHSLSFKPFGNNFLVSGYLDSCIFKSEK